MTAGGLPTVHVYLDDGTGTFPYDVTSFVRLKDGYKITRGRSDELSEAQPGTLNLTFDNTSGAFTLGAPTYGVKNDQLIRVTVTVGATTSNRFTGFVQSWPVNWPDGSDQFATAAILAVDASARWTRRTLQSMLAETVLAGNPVAYWPLTDPAGAAQASNLVPGGDPLVVQKGTVALPATFGVDTGLADAGTGVAIDDNGDWLATTLAITDSGAGLLMEGFISTTAGGSRVFCQLASISGSTIVISSDFTGTHATAQFAPGTPGDGAGSVNVGGTAVINDGEMHHLAVQVVWNGTTTRTVKLYVDGVLNDTGSTAGATAAATYGPLRLRETATYARFAINADATTIALRAGAGLAGTTDRSDLRIARLLAFEGTLATTVGDTGMVMVPNQDTAGKTVTAAVESVVAAEVGLLWINGYGQAQLANKDHVALATTAAMTIAVSSDMVDPGTGFTGDMQQVTNYVTGMREGDDGVQVVSNPASIGSGGTGHGTYPLSITWLVQTDVEVLSRAQWLVTKYAEPAARLPTLGLDLMTADQANQILALGLDLTSHLRVTGWPSQSPGGSSTDLVEEGFVETLTDSAWDLVLNCASWTQQAALILDDATYGVLDTNSLGI